MSFSSEVKEELGICLNESEFELHDVYKHKNYFMDIYVVKKDFSEEEIILDKNEVVDWKWMSQKEIEHFIETEKMVRSVGIRYKMFGMNLLSN